MTSRERVETAFDHRLPDKIPRWCGASPEFWEKAKTQLDLDDEELRVRFGDDFRRVFSRYVGPEPDLAEGATWESPFGVQRTGIGYGQPISHPLKDARSVREIEAWRWPDPDWVDVSHIAADARRWDGYYAVLGGEWSPYWHDAIDLVGQVELYYMMYDYPEVAEALFDRIVDFYWKASERVFEAVSREIDIFFVGNDFGSQTGPLLSVDLFKRFLLPGLSRLIALGHRYGLRVMLHCCGGIRPLIPLMIDAGLDGLHALQPDAGGMDPPSLKRDFGDAILLNGAIDSHHILINGKSPAWVQEQTRALLEVLAEGGGYVAGASHDTILEETPVEHVLAMFDAVEEYSASDRYRHGTTR